MTERSQLILEWNQIVQPAAIVSKNQALHGARDRAGQGGPASRTEHLVSYDLFTSLGF